MSVNDPGKVCLSSQVLEKSLTFDVVEQTKNSFGEET
jgi:hypothetical protein